MDKEEVAHISYGVLLGHKKSKIMPFAVKQMDLKIVIVSEVSGQRRRNNHIISLLICQI